MSEINKININGTGYDIGSRGGTGLTNEAKTALLACFAKIAWIDEDGQDYYDALYAALYPPANLTSISCVYTQGGTVYDSDTLDSLKTDLVVTAHYDDSSTSVVTGYTLSGTLTAGISTITVSYGGKTTTFTVTVTHAPVYVKNIAIDGTFIRSSGYADGSTSSQDTHLDIYSISDVKADDVINLVCGWNSEYFTLKKQIATTGGSAPNVTLGTFTRHAYDFGVQEVTINEDYESLYVAVMNTDPSWAQYATWTREDGF